ncbi:MAG: RNA polymerase sigma factor [Lachnospiraceae bacterium]|nr:RNA polymerase sigma factor [Lachnospiraceae bacterium]
MTQIYVQLFDELEEWEEFEKLYEQYSEKMYGIAYGILHSQHDAEDAVHDSFLAIINNFKKIQKLTCHERWKYIVIIVKSRAINIYNKNEKRFQKEVKEQIYSADKREKMIDPEEKCIENDNAKILMEMILRLPEIKRQVLYMHYYMNKPYSQIGLELGMSEENVRQIASRARKKMEKLLRERGITNGNE